MIALLCSALLGGLLTATLFWLWQGDWWFALLLAPIGGSFAALAVAAVLALGNLLGRKIAYLTTTTAQRRHEERKPADSVP